MDKEFEIKFGEEITPDQKLRISENEICGPYWSIKKVGRACQFEFDSGSHGSGLEKFTTPIEIFEKIKTGELDADDIINKYWTR